MMDEFLKSRAQGKMTNEFATMLMTLTKRYASRPNFSGYSYVEDMESHALMQMCHSWKQFDPDKSNNPFAFYTQCIKNSFFFFLNKEKRVRVIRDRELMYAGMDTSFSFQEEHSSGFDTSGFDSEPLDSEPNSPDVDLES